MPTGYTAGIIDGKIKTFPEFAKICMRAMRATIHMRDENLDADYQTRMCSEHHIKAISTARKLLKDTESKSDKQILSERKKYLEERKAYHEKRIEETKVINQILSKILLKANQYEPPSPDHEGVKDFMINQLEDTLKHDGSSSYSEEQLLNVKNELHNLNADVIRSEMIEKANKDISYHLKEHKDDLDRCSKSNQWVRDFLESLK